MHALTAYRQEELSDKFGVRGIPTLVFVDAEGKVLTKVC